MTFTNLILRALPDNQLLYRFCRRYVDRHLSQNNSDMRTNGEKHLLQQRMPVCHTVFDVGANLGQWAALSLQINPLLDLHCFEASQATYQRFQQQPVAGRVTHRCCAVGATEGVGNLYTFAEGSGMNSMYRRSGLEPGYHMETQRTSESVPMISLDAYCEGQKIDRINYLKLDVEGYEMEVLRGASRLLAERRIDLIQFEYGGCNIDAGVLLKDFLALLLPLGYQLHKIHPKRLKHHPRYDQRLENFQYQNWAALLDRAGS